jgi:hypothetical protein
LPQHERVTRLQAKEVDMVTVMAVLLFSLWGVMVFAAPRRKRYSRWTSVGDSSIEGEDNPETGGGEGVGDSGCGDGGGGDGGGGD